MTKHSKTRQIMPRNVFDRFSFVSRCFLYSFCRYIKIKINRNTLKHIMSFNQHLFPILCVSSTTWVWYDLRRFYKENRRSAATVTCFMFISLAHINPYVDRIRIVSHREAYFLSVRIHTKREKERDEKTKRFKHKHKNHETK